MIREDEKRQAEDQLEVLLLESLQGEESEVNAAAWSDIRKEALEHLKSRRKAR